MTQGYTIVRYKNESKWKARGSEGPNQSSSDRREKKIDSKDWISLSFHCLCAGSNNQDQVRFQVAKDKRRWRKRRWSKYRKEVGLEKKTMEKCDAKVTRQLHGWVCQKHRRPTKKLTGQPTSLDKLGACPNEICTQQLTLALISRKLWLGLSIIVCRGQQRLRL